MSRELLSEHHLLKRAALILVSPVAFAFGIAFGIWYAAETLIEMWQSPNDWRWL